MRATGSVTGGRLAGSAVAEVPIPLASRSIWLACVPLRTISPVAYSASNFSPRGENTVHRRQLWAICFWKECWRAVFHLRL